MQERGLGFSVVSTDYYIEDEITGQTNRIEQTLNDVAPASISEYNGLMIVSGNMKDTELYWKLPRTLEYVEVARKNNLPIAAICCSVPTIRFAAEGKRVSFFPLLRSRELLGNAGAILSTTSISVDGNLVTAEHQMATQVWAALFTDLVLTGKVSDPGLIDSGFTPGKKRPRKPIAELEYLKSLKRGNKTQR